MENYRLIERRGEGTFGEVWEAESRVTGQRAAVKILKRKKATPIYEEVEYRVLSRFVRKPAGAAACDEELESTLTTCSGSGSPSSSSPIERKASCFWHVRPQFHPHITGLYDAFHDAVSGKNVYVLELLEGTLLDELLRRRRHAPPHGPLFSFAELRQILLQVLGGIDAMHQIGIFHRDIKPENILVQRLQSGEPFEGGSLRLKLADFGSSQFMEQTRFLPRGGEAAGEGGRCFTEYIATRWYRSPECLLTNGRYGPPLDLWAVGCLAAELITGRPLFPGEDETDQLRLIHSLYTCPSLANVEEKLGTVGDHVSALLIGPTKPQPPSSAWSHIFLRRKTIAPHHSLSHPSRDRWNKVVAPKIYPDLPEDLSDLLYRLLAYYPQERLTAHQALQHRFFQKRN